MHQRSLQRWLPAGLAVALLAGCALKPPPQPDEIVAQALPPTTRLPPVWQAGAASAPVPGAWLKSFLDPQLDAIVAEAQAHNIDLRFAAARVEIAQQQVIVAGAALQPQVGAQLGARSVYDKDAGQAFNGTQAFVGVAWELDVWGRLRAQRDAAGYVAQASALDEVWARESLAALVAKAWFLGVQTRQLMALSEQAVAVYAKLRELVLVRRKAGRDSDLNVTVIDAKLAGSQSAVEAAQQAYGEARRALETLLGRYPAAEIEVAAVYGPLPPPSAAGVPSALLQRRADMVAAQRLVLAAFRQQEVAELSLLPSFGLSLNGGRLGDQLLSLLSLNPWMAGAAIGMSIPIYEGGALKAQVAIATAQQAAAVAQYGSAALTALREVEDALANERYLALQLPLDERALASRTQSVKIATTQFIAGRTDMLWVAQLQTEQLATESNLIRLRGTQRANRVRLYQALGGGFGDAPEVAAHRTAGTD